MDNINNIPVAETTPIVTGEIIPGVSNGQTNKIIGIYPNDQKLTEAVPYNDSNEPTIIENASAPPNSKIDEPYAPSAPPLSQSDTNVDETLNEIWKQTQVNLCLLVAMLKEKKNTDKSKNIDETIQKIENAIIPDPLGKIQCDSDVIAPILSKIKNTMKLINKDLSNEQILDRLLASNISLIKKYIQLYVDISKKEEVFLDISKTIDNLLNSMSSLNVGKNQDQGQSIGSMEASELVIETFAMLVGSSQMIAGKKFKRRSRKSRKSKKKKLSKKRRSRKSKKHRKLTR